MTAFARLAATVLSEYEGPGPVLEVSPLGGSGTALAIRTARGMFVLKPAWRRADVELQALAAGLLAESGIGQALVLPCASGALVTSTGHYLQELLPGAAVLQPDAGQVDAVMRHIGAFHRVLAGLPGCYSAGAGSLWTRVADTAWLVRELPGLLSRVGLADPDLLTALSALGAAGAELGSLPRQVVHGDLGPDNVLMDGPVVVAVVDFTPHYESSLFGAATALYWYHVYGRAEVDADRLGRSVDLLGEARPWSPSERRLWPVALLREALRRLATPLALDTPQAPSVSPRLAAVRAAADIMTVVQA
jgi:Ser/Thr protein kinase RdoA (MazF antagonist)